MPKIDEMVPSKSNFLTKEDVTETGRNLTIGRFEQQEVGIDNNKELRFVIVWQQADYKPMVLNKENANRLKVIFKTDDTDQMIGKTINVYADPMVSFGGKIVGGIRVRAAAQRQAQARPAARQPQRSQERSGAVGDDPNDELPPLEAYDDTQEVPF